jgi:23S rRNA (cytosine1962-C5)-methyltransferase
MHKVILKRKISNRILNGHPWIFANEVENVEGTPGAGDIVEVFFMAINFLVKDILMHNRK